MRKNFASFYKHLLSAVLLIILSGNSQLVLAVNIKIDYSLDDNGFFDTSTENGLLARQNLETVASYFSALLTDNFSSIAATGNDRFSAVFQHPSSNEAVQINQLKIPQDTIVIYVGAKDLQGTLLGYAGIGGYQAQGSPAFLDNIASRGQHASTRGDDAKDVAPWGGYLSFDLYTDWYFDDELSSNDVPERQFDFYSNALHEFGHLLGIGTSDAWFNRTAYSYFEGEHSNEHFRDLIPLHGDLEHWADDVFDVNHNGNRQPAALTSRLRAGERKEFTLLDITALQDIGWQVDNQVALNTIPQRSANTIDERVMAPDDFNQDGYSDLIWKDSDNGQLVISYLHWEESATELKASVLEQENWLQMEDTNWQLIAIEHLDNDQHPDFIWWHQLSGEIAIWYMEGTQLKWFHTPFEKRDPKTWIPVAANDFDNDGHPDLVWRNPDTAHIEIWYINNWGSDNTQITEVSQPFNPDSEHDILIEAADFDSNGTADFIFYNSKTHNYSLWLLDKQNVLEQIALQWNVDNFTHLVAVKDYNQDGTPDLIWQANHSKSGDTAYLVLITLNEPSIAKTETSLTFSIPDKQYTLGN